MILILFTILLRKLKLEMQLTILSKHLNQISKVRGIYEICRHNNLPIVIASSDKAYGISDVLPYKENFELKESSI